MRHLTPKTKAFLTGNFFFFLSFNKYDPLIVLKRNPVVPRLALNVRTRGLHFQSTGAMAEMGNPDC